MILFKHNETPTSHVYTTRQLGIWLFYAFAGLFILMTILYNTGDRDLDIVRPLFIIWLVLLAILIIDTTPMLIRQIGANFKGKARKMTGNAFHGARYEIEK